MPTELHRTFYRNGPQETIVPFRFQASRGHTQNEALICRFQNAMSVQDWKKWVFARRAKSIAEGRYRKHKERTFPDAFPKNQERDGIRIWP